MCPTSRRGHTATLVVGRRMVHPTLSMTSAAPSSTHADTQHPAATESSDAAASPRNPSSSTLDRRGGDTGGGGRPGKMSLRRGAAGERVVTRYTRGLQPASESKYQVHTVYTYPPTAMDTKVRGVLRGDIIPNL